MVTRHVQPVPQQAQRRVMMTDVVVHDDYRESGEQTVSLGALQAKKQKTFEAILGEDFDTNSTAYRIIAYCLNKSPELAGRELAYTEPLMAGSIHGWILMMLADRSSMTVANLSRHQRGFYGPLATLQADFTNTVRSAGDHRRALDGSRRYGLPPHLVRAVFPARERLCV
jgi:hypothetical protein